MMKHPLAVFAAAAIALLSNAPAHAGTGSATATLSSLTFTLIDLDLTDGVTPSLSFLAAEYTSSRSAYGTVYRIADNASMEGEQRRTFLTQEPVAMLATGSATASMTGATAASISSETGFSAQSNATTGNTDIVVAGAETNPTEWGRTFVISANTALMIEADYLLEASLLNRVNPQEVASASLLLEAYLKASTSAGQEVKSFFDYAYTSAETGDHDQKSGHIKFTFENASSSNREGFFTQVGARTYVAVGAVPEADTSLMAMLGLGAMGAVAARRRQQKLG